MLNRDETARKFICNNKECGFIKIYDADEPVEIPCPKCGKKVFTVKYGLQERGSCEDHPRWSESLGCSPEEIPAFEKLYPGSEYHPETGQLLIKNRQHKISEMKRRGYVELD